ncbi:MAG TPA: 2-oxo acid dehydrogenase subunit E2 [Anaerolineales bacterium]|nr:2-oxo acid dehydrogenase subunit E2 [Anaerolineales bacterium]HRQ93316.1 2-oxo acid dehydrogenase subunit E2 [Anaerolineales bacterium]
MAVKVTLPQMGEGVTDATVTKWLKQEGEQVKEYDPLVEVNTDKVDTEIPSPASGTILKILQAEGAVVPVNATLVWIGEPGEALPADESSAAPAAAPKAAVQPVAAAPTPVPASPSAVKPIPAAQPLSLQATPAASQPQATPAGGPVSALAAKVAAEHGVNLAAVHGSGPAGRITKEDVLAAAQAGTARFVPGAVAPAASGPVTLPSFDGHNMATFLSPVVRKLAAEHNIDVSRMRGTGEGGRITKADIEVALSNGSAYAPVQFAAPQAQAPKPHFPPAFPEAIPGTVMKLNPVRRAIAEHMVRSKHTSPHVTTVMEIDMSRVGAHRAANKAAFAQQGVNLTFTAYFVNAIVAACNAYPIVNSSWSDEGVAVHGAVNLGIATALEPDGLIVPVVKNAGSMSLLEMARAVNDLSTRARNKGLKTDEVQGGTITLTNHGTSGSLFATPIINQPQCAIIGTGAIQKRAVVIDDAIAIRPMVYTTLTFDHRILDGAVADYFLGTIKFTLENWA